MATEVSVRPVAGPGGDADGLKLVTFSQVRSSVIPGQDRQRAEDSDLLHLASTWEESDEKFRILFEYAPDAYYLCDLTGRFLDGNKAAEKIAGIKREEAIGKTFLKLNFLPRRQIPAATRILVKSAVGKPTGPNEFTLRRKDGATIPVEIRTYPIRVRGQVLILGIARDITERKRAEKRLQESEMKYRQLHQCSRDGCVATDLEGRIQESNEAYREMLGYTEQEIKQLTYTDLTPQKWHAVEAEIVEAQVFTRGYSSLFEKEYIRKDGTIFPIELRVYLKKDLAGKPVGMWAIVRDITKRRKAEEELRQSDERFRAMTNSAQDAILMMDPQGRVTFYNKTAQAMFGWTAAEVLGENLHTLIAPKKYHEAYHKGLAHFSHSGTGPAVGKTLELTALRKDGTEFPIEISLAGVELNDQWHAIGIVRDITERKQAEEAILKEKAFCDSVINFLPGVFYMFDETGRFVWWNKHLEEVSECSAEEVSNRNALEMFAPADRDLVAERIANVFSGGSGAVEANVVSKSGRVTPYFMTGVRIERDGRPLLLGYGIDVTERKQAQEELLREKAFADSVINSVPGIFYMLDEAGQYVWWNRNFEQVLGYSATEIPRVHPLHLFGDADREMVRERIAQVFAEGKATAEAHLVCKSGRTIPYLLTGNRVERKGKAHLVGMGLDITERYHARMALEKLNAELEASIHELERSNNELRDFAHITAHDLKAPLRGIGTLAEWLDKDCGDEIAPESRENLQLLRQRVKRMECLINGILRYSEIGHGDQPLEVLDAGAVVAEAIEQVAASDHIKIDVDGVLPSVWAERTRLTQVFQNLISNAAKYGDKVQGEIHIGARDRGDAWEFYVADNGPGIESKHFERIFRMFQSLSPSEHSDSTGLGLAVVKKIVEMYGGQIRVESEPGRGSTFLFTLPKHESVQVDSPLTATEK